MKNLKTGLMYLATFATVGFFATFVLVVYAENTPTDVNITSHTLSNSNFTVELNGNGVPGNAGKPSQYFYQFDWGDGTIEEDLGFDIVGSNWTRSHTYSTYSNYTVKVTLYHQAISGTEKDESSLSYTLSAPINGTCGSANGVSTISIPTQNLCLTGTASEVSTGTSSYTWSCVGSSNGTNASCSAPIAIGDNDQDDDTVLDDVDNCPTIPNSDQADNDQDNIGNVCDETPNPLPTTGILEIIKNVLGSDGQTDIVDLVASFVVQITRNEFTATSTVSEGTSAFFPGLSAGTYNVSEIQLPGGYAFVSVSSSTPTVLVGATTTVIITNKLVTNEIDLCSNIEGNQETLPEGYTANGDVCSKESLVNDDEEPSSRSGSRRRTPTSVGEVLGATTDGGLCEAAIIDYMKLGLANNPDQVVKLQNFLNTQGYYLPVTGFFGKMTDEAVRAFQLKYKTDVLKPWQDIGLGNENVPTGYVYKTTLWKINDILCGDAGPFPLLP